MNANLSVGAVATFEGLARPWAPLSSIYRHLIRLVDPATRALTHSSVPLPAAAFTPGGQRFQFAPVVEDSPTVGSESSAASLEPGPLLATAILELARYPSDLALARVFGLAVATPLLGIVDDVIDGVLVGLADTPRNRVLQLGRFLAGEGGHHAAVKLGIVLIGISAETDADVLLVRDLGLHDEFTLFAAAALSCQKEPEPHLFHLAQRVQGWGRIHLVERLANTQSPEVRRWLLCDGYSNPVMTEYLAYVCAKAGDLAGALSHESVDDGILLAAAGMLHAMCHEEVHGITGVESIMDYEDAPRAAECYLWHVAHTRTQELEHFIAVDSIWRFLDAPEVAQHLATSWGAAVERCKSMAEMIVAREDWPALARAAQGLPDRASAWCGDEVAARLGLDAWPVLAERVRADPLGEGPWTTLVDETTSAQVDELVRLVAVSLPIAEIASGPADELGIGPAFRAHSRLGIVLHGLSRFPQQGWPLIAVGLRSPVIHNRVAALRALSAWPRESWPADVVSAVEHNRDREPVASVRDQLDALLAL